MNKGILEAKSTKESDEYYTPQEPVEVISSYLKEGSTVWCPFDKEQSQFVQVLRKKGHKVIFSHIDEGKDFFVYEPEEYYDYIISNPPFSCKDKVLKRLYELNRPWAMLLPINTLQGQKRFPYLKDCQAIIFDKRINYYTDLDFTKRNKGIPFASIFICKNILPKDLLFVYLELE